MSQANVEVVRKACEAWERGELETWLGALHPEVVWDSSRFAGWEEGAIYRGRNQVRAFLVDDWRASWHRYDALVEEIADVGDRVLVLWWQRMVDAAGGTPIEVRSAQVCSVGDGLICRMDNYTDRAEALNAVELSE
jgi:ketosteroid isomerase-like protein